MESSESSYDVGDKVLITSGEYYSDFGILKSFDDKFNEWRVLVVKDNIEVTVVLSEKEFVGPDVYADTEEVGSSDEEMGESDLLDKEVAVSPLEMERMQSNGGSSIEDEISVVSELAQEDEESPRKFFYEYKVLESFMTESRPPECIRKDWIVVVREIDFQKEKGRGKGIMRVDHPHLRTEQWIRECNWSKLQGLIHFRDNGLTHLPIRRDGNCFYNACAIVLHRLDATLVPTQEQFREFMAANLKQMQDDEDDSLNAFRLFDPKELSNILSSGQWQDDISDLLVTLVHRMFGVNVNIYDSQGFLVPYQTHYDESYRDTISFLYTGSHYDALVDARQEAALMHLERQIALRRQRQMIMVLALGGGFGPVNEP